MKTIILSKQVLTDDIPSQAEPITPGMMVKVNAFISGSGAVDALLVLQASDTPTIEDSWVDTGLSIQASGMDEALATDFAFVNKRFYRLWVPMLNAMKVYAVVSHIEESDHPDNLIALDNASFAVKSKVFKLPSRKPITLDVLISGTVTVRLYASNMENQSAGSRWGAPLREFTSSTKVIIENEPWVNWMVEYASGTGIASVAVGV